MSCYISVTFLLHMVQQESSARNTNQLIGGSHERGETREARETQRRWEAGGRGRRETLEEGEGRWETKEVERGRRDTKEVGGGRREKGNTRGGRWEETKGKQRSWKERNE